MLHTFVVSNLCFACFASQAPALCSAIPSAHVKFIARLCCILLHSVIFCFAFFASQTSGLSCAFPSAPVKSVTRFCNALVRTLFCVVCLTNTGFVQCYSLGCRKVCCTLLFHSVIFLLRALPHKHRVCAVLFPSAPLKFTPFCFTLIVLFSFVLLRVLCPTSSGLRNDFSPAPLEFARLIFCFVLFSFNFVFCVFFPH